MSRRDQTVDPAIASRDEEIERLKDVVERYSEGINDLIDSHAPRMDASAREHVHPGWSNKTISFYCERCRVAWPCPAIHDLRTLYGKATKWEYALRPYEPLTLRLAEPAPEPEHEPTPEPAAGEGSDA